MKLRLDRLLSYPCTRMLSREGDVARVRIEGWVCSDVCAARSQQALARMPGVRRVEVDFDSGIATMEGAPADAAAYQRAIDSVVAGKALRRMLDRLRRARSHETGTRGDAKAAV